MDIKTDALRDGKVAALLEEHLRDMYSTSPPESVHALDIDQLRHPSITFYSAWKDDELLGCAAIKMLTPTHGELKSMRTSDKARKQGVGKTLLEHVIQQAQQNGVERLSLETGSMAFFTPARNLYSQYGFDYCGPFADYVDDPNSRFMTKELV
ncbi:GNAT family N-acetyltransferase [Vibrio sp. SCSIO 43136]|uniref:GNAT family N-acetyltransferase n=1 Tax=Vibrio sp. SCSIO 43136 TaxID=2819101 RepID=UPI002075D1AE|nr:GNAT family N-acetyltransferase [Vibrio sp. SCSIO 43136]USD64032.1 GNAT family N-acetyltransferase [Vibrio sp. SCSIO 43136]